MVSPRALSFKLSYGNVELDSNRDVRISEAGKFKKNHIQKNNPIFFRQKPILHSDTNFKLSLISVDMVLIAILGKKKNSYSLIKVASFFTRQGHSDSGQGSNPDRSLRSPAR